MKPIDEAIAVLIGREPTSEEIAKFYKVKEICQFSEHDSVWSILLAFGHYEILYGEISKNISVQTRDLLAVHKDALEAAATAAERHVKANLVDSVARTAKELAQQAIDAAGRITIAKSRSYFLLGATASAAVVVMLMCAVAWFSFEMGARSAAGDVAWAASAEGKAAREFAALNDLTVLMKCDGFQRRTEGGKVFCLPHDGRKVGGWRIQ